MGKKIKLIDLNNLIKKRINEKHLTFLKLMISKNAFSLANDAKFSDTLNNFFLKHE